MYIVHPPSPPLLHPYLPETPSEIHVTKNYIYIYINLKIRNCLFLSVSCHPHSRSVITSAFRSTDVHRNFCLTATLPIMRLHAARLISCYQHQGFEVSEQFVVFDNEEAAFRELFKYKSSLIFIEVDYSKRNEPVEGLRQRKQNFATWCQI